MRQSQNLFGRSRLGLNRGLATAAMVARVGLEEAEEGAGGKAVSYVFSPFLLFSLLCLSAPPLLLALCCCMGAPQVALRLKFNKHRSHFDKVPSLYCTMLKKTEGCDRYKCNDLKHGESHPIADGVGVEKPAGGGEGKRRRRRALLLITSKDGRRKGRRRSLPPPRSKRRLGGGSFLGAVLCGQAMGWGRMGERSDARS